MKKLLTIALLSGVCWPAWADTPVADWNPPSNAATTNEKRLDLDLELDNINSTKMSFDADLAVIAGLADPNADRIMFWDDSAGAWAHLTIGAGLLITGTTIEATGAGGGDSVRVEDGDNTAAFTAAVDPDFDDGGDIDFVLDTGPNPDTITGLVRANSVALSTDTTGNYQSGNTAGAGIAITQTPAEGFSSTVALDYADQGASPALGADACQFTSNATTSGMIVCEGDTADAFETRIQVTDPTADRLVTIPNADSATIQPLTCGGGDFVSAVSALGVISCGTPAGGSGDSIRVEDGDDAGTFTAATDADFGDSGDINFAVNTAASPDEITGTVRADSVALTTDTTGNYAAGDAEAGAALTGDSATSFFGAGTLEDARVDGSTEADELVLAGDVDGTANANDLDEVNVETELESVLDLADMQGDLALGTKTSGNYVDDVIAGTGIAVTHTPGEGSDATVALSFSDAGTDPALGVDECRFTSNATTGGYIVCEGDTADTIETRIVVTDPTASDKTFTIPNGNSVGLTDADKGDITVGTAGTDFQIDAGVVGANEAAALDAGDITTGTFADALVDGSLEADEVNPTLGTQTAGDYVASVADGTGIDGSTTGETQTYTPTLDLSEINSTVFGSGTFTTLGFNAGAVDPVFTFGSGTVDLSAVTTFTLDDELELRFNEEDAGGSNYIGFKAPAALTANVTCVFENDGNPIPDSCVGDGTDAGAGGGDDVTVNAGAVTNPDLDDATPAAPVNALNVQWQVSGSDVSAHIDFAEVTDLTAIAVDDTFLIKDTSATAIREIRGDDVFEIINVLTEETAPVAGDFLPLYDTSAGTADKVNVNKIGVGKQPIALLAGAGTVPSGGGIAGCTVPAVQDSGTNDVFFKVCQFSASADNALYWTIPAPKSSDETIDWTLRIDWTSTTTTDATDDVIWTASAVCFSNDDAINGNAFPAVDTVTDTQTAAGDFLSTSAITAITPAGTWTENDACVLRVTRDADAAGDNFNGTADLINAQLFITTNANTDD